MSAEALVLWDAVEEHLEEAGFQWERWERALVSPLLRARQVVDGVEARLAAHIEGLTISAFSGLRCMKASSERHSQQRPRSSSCPTASCGSKTRFETPRTSGATS
jgi:hypothetical protein